MIGWRAITILNSEEAPTKDPRGIEATAVAISARKVTQDSSHFP